MARTVRHAQLETRAQRLRLAGGRRHWCLIEQGRHLGYVRGPEGSSWIARLYVGAERYMKRVIGRADDVLDADGVAVMTFAQAQAAARDWFAAVTAAAAAAAAPPRATVADAVAAYLEDYRRRAGRAVGDAKLRLERHVLPDLGATALAELTTERLRAWHHGLILAIVPGRRRKPEAAAEIAPARRRKAAPRRKPATTATIEEMAPETLRRRRSSANRMLSILKAALNHAFEEGSVDSDRAWRRVKPFRDVDRPRVHWLDPAESTRLVNACDPDMRRLVTAALLSGARMSELFRLRCRDYVAASGTLFIAASKSGRARHVYLTPRAREWFALITAGRDGAQTMLQQDPPAAPTAAVPDADGATDAAAPAKPPARPRDSQKRPWQKMPVVRALRRACLAARIQPAVSFHILRHSYASALIQGGVSNRVVAENLGHADTRMVDKHYGHLAPSHVRAAIDGAAIDLVEPAGGDPVVAAFTPRGALTP